MRRVFVLVLLASLLGGLSQALVQSADVSPADTGKAVPGFALKDPRDGKAVALADYKDSKAICVFFVGVECPINNAYLPRLAELHKKYAAEGVQFLAVNSNQQDPADKVAAHARKSNLPFPVLKDDGQAVADLFGARRTPEAFLLDAQRRIVYHGRIDDQFGVGYQKPRATSLDLVSAIDALLAGKPVAVAEVPPSGCLIGRAPKPKAEAAVTYCNQVARIMQAKCQECHRAERIGPMPLMTYQDAADWSAMIREVVDQGRMPPWHADPRYGHFTNDRSLSTQDRETLLAWIDQGCPKGNEKDLPAAKQFNDQGWSIGKPDVVLTMTEEFAVPAEMPKYGVPYKYFTVPTNFTEDKWITRAEARPGAGTVVHHIVIFIVPPGEQFQPNDPRGAVLCGTAPGDMPFMCPEGMAKKVPAGSKLVFQMHYTPNGLAAKDRSSVGLIFAKNPPERRVLTAGVANPRFLIPPGDANYEVESQFTFRENALIMSFMPHMHVRGKDFFIEVIYPDGKKETVLSVPHFDFGWQSAYRLEKPLAVPKGTRLHCVAHFDNSVKNPNNPDPTKEVFWGDQTWEEMMIGWTDFCFDKKAQ